MSSIHTPSATGRLLTTAEVAALFGVHVRTVSRWADRGELPRIRVGGIARFRAEDVERLIAPDHDASPAGQPSSSHDKADARGPYRGDWRAKRGAAPA